MTASIPRRDYGANAERIHYTPAYRPVTNDWIIRHRSGEPVARGAALGDGGIIATWRTAAEVEKVAAALNREATGEDFAA